MGIDEMTKQKEDLLRLKIDFLELCLDEGCFFRAQQALQERAAKIHPGWYYDLDLPMSRRVYTSPTGPPRFIDGGGGPLTAAWWLEMDDGDYEMYNLLTREQNLRRAFDILERIR